MASDDDEDQTAFEFEDQEAFNFDEWVKPEGSETLINIEDLPDYYEQEPEGVPDEIKEQVSRIFEEYQEEELRPIVAKSYQDTRRTAPMKLEEVKKKFKEQAEKNIELIKSEVGQLDLSKYANKIKHLNHTVLTKAIERVRTNFYQGVTYDELRYVRFIYVLKSLIPESTRGITTQ